MTRVLNIKTNNIAKIWTKGKNMALNEKTKAKTCVHDVIISKEHGIDFLCGLAGLPSTVHSMVVVGPWSP